MQNSALAQSIAAMVVILAPMTAWEAYLGHFRSGFPLKAQYAPLITAAVLILAGALTLVAPGRGTMLVQSAGWIGLAAGLIGTGYHHYFDPADKPRGYRGL